jgi:tricorn protease
VNRLNTFLVFLILLVVGSAAANNAPGYVMRYADIGGGNIVFTYEGDLWLVPDTGGDARRITSHEGNEMVAKFNQDGSQLAFTGSYDGGRDVYLMDATGGVPKRLTFHPAADTMVDWCPDGVSVFVRSNRDYPSRASELYRYPLDGGMPTKMPLDRAGLASVDPQRTGIAYNRIGREMRTWKRYEGGMAQDIWVNDFSSGETTKITDWDGTDNFPMWEGRTIYFTSDREDGTLNIYGYDLDSKTTTRLTFYSDYDVKYPSLGDGKIVFQHGPGLKVLDLKAGSGTEPRVVPINIPSDRRHVRTELVTPDGADGSFSLSPAGERVLVEARGEILNLPADEGDPLNLTRTSGSRERNAVWSPDGKQVAFVSDHNGEQQIYLTDQLGQDQWRQLTDGIYGFILPLVWSPDSKYLLFADKFMNLNLIDVGAGKVSVVAHSDFDDAWERWGIQDYVWSPDSRWIVYTSNGDNMNESLYLYNMKQKETHRLTGDMSTAWSPSFSPDGKYLYFLSNRTFNPIMGRQDQNHVFLKMALPYVFLLQGDARSPFYTEDVLVSTGDKEEKDDKKDKKDETVIDLEGLTNRVLVCAEVEPGNYFRLTATDDGFLMLRKNDPEFLKYQNVNDHTGGALDLVKYSLSDASLEDLMSGVANYHLSADGKKMVYRAGGNVGVVDAGKKAKTGDGKVDVGAIKLRLDRLAEYRQIFAEAWRVQRDWFYDKNMHGVDWQAMHDKYAPFVDGCGSRGDLNYLIGEMIAELNIGHTYIYGGDFGDRGDFVPTGLLGCSFTPEEKSEYYRITNIVPGVSWDPAYRSPLTEPGVPVSEGDYLVAIDGVEIKVGENVYERLVDKAGKMVSLTTNGKPSNKDAVTTRVRTLRGERGLRYRAWVDANLDYVTEKTDGQIGYLHIPNMMDAGLVEFGRTWYPQTGKQAIIIDERYNGGGFVGDMIIDRLERELWSMTIPREGQAGRNPERAFHGPLVVLINEDTGSNGEFFAEAIKRKKLATVMGVRTWGGSIGIEPHQGLVDGATTTPPQFGLYALDGTWPIEGWGVEPDIIVMNMPADVVNGEDTQLDTAIEFLLKQLDESGGKWAIPPTPAYPDKSKPGMSKNDQ